MKRLLTIGAVVAALALAAVVVGGAVTSAQEGGGPLDTFVGKLAGKLGISQDKLTSAIKEAHIETVDDLVAQGKLTEEQAQNIKERIESGEVLFPPPPREHPRPVVCRAARLVVGAAADVLDMEKEQLVQELKSGKSLAEVAEAQGMSVDDFTEALLDQVKARLDDAVEQGKITQEQADRAFQGIQERIDRIVNAHIDAEHNPCGPGGPPPGDGQQPEEPF